jgi:hypothetical protein
MTMDSESGADRRTMLKAMGAVTMLSAAGAAPLSKALAASAAAPKRYDQAMRWMQVAFTEDNPPRYDPQMWFDYFKEAKVEGVCLSAGGGTAFYPTSVPFHRRARDLGDRDMLGEMIAGSKALGMAVVARLDPHYLRDDAFAAHPEWVVRSPNGQPRRHPVAPDVYLACPNGPFMSTFMTDVITELSSRYPIDGIFGNRWGGYTSVCYCESCKSQFKAASGFDIPASVGSFGMPAMGHPEEDAARAYLLWYQDKRFEQIDLWTRTAKAVRPELFFVGGPLNGIELDPNRLTQSSPILFVDHQMRKDDSPPWDNGRMAKQMRGFMGKKPIVGIFSISYRWKDATQSDAEIATWVADGAAHGFRPWMTKFNADPIDKRWMPIVAQRYNWQADRERYLKNTANLARVALVHSPETTTFYGRAQATAKVEDHQSGYYQALFEARIPFEMVDARELDPAHIDRFRVLVLPNIAALSDKQCGQIRDFVRKGGRIVATHETSLYDEAGKRRKNFGLADLFGCDFAGQVEERNQNSYITLRGPHPLLRGLETAPRVMGTVKRVEIKATDASPQPLTLVPRYPDQPIERVYTDTPTTNIPMVMCRQAGAGRVVYFPNDLDRTFWQYLSVDHLALLRNAVEWAADEAAPLTVTGPGAVDVSYWRQDGSLTVHLVNLSNPMTMRGPIREILPIGPFEVSVALPAGANVRGVRLLDSGKVVRGTKRGDRLVVTVPSIGLHEIVAFDLG